MSLRNSISGWGVVTRSIHWIMAALILFMLGLGVYMTNFVPDPFRQFDLTQLHKSWGFVVFCLAVTRVLWRLYDRTSPAEPATMPRWQVIAAKSTHGLLYLLILVMPLSGWVLSAASPTQDLLNIRNMVFGWFAMPDPWVPGVKVISDTAGAVHYYAALLMAAILVLHVAAALKHAFIDRDGVLSRMIIGK